MTAVQKSAARKTETLQTNKQLQLENVYLITSSTSFKSANVLGILRNTDAPLTTLPVVDDDETKNILSNEFT